MNTAKWWHLGYGGDGGVVDAQAEVEGGGGQ
jgi:hypothetical protein